MTYNWMQTPKSIFLDSLNLDYKNPRISNFAGNDQGAVLKHLLQQKKAHIRTLAEKISQQGYMTLESLIVLYEDGKLYVLEGNCRVAACKLLQNPKKAGNTKDENYFKNLKSSMPATISSTFEKIQCVEAPSRTIANPILYELHVGKPKESWSTYAQGGYNIENKLHHNQRDRELIIAKRLTDCVQSIAKQYYDSQEIYQKIQNAFIEDKLSEILAGVRRLLNNKTARENLNITKYELNENLHIVFETSDEDAKKLLASLTTEALKGNLTTRTTNNESAIIKYLKGYITTEKTVQRKTSSSSTPKTGRPKKEWLLPPIEYQNISIPKHRKLEQMLKETGKIEYKKCPYLATLCLRGILETLLKSIIADRNELNSPKNSQRRVGLAVCIKHFTENKNILDPEISESMKSKLLGKGEFKYMMDITQHGIKTTISEQDITELKNFCEPIISNGVDLLQAKYNNHL